MGIETPSDLEIAVQYADVEAAAHRLQNVAHRTPVGLSSSFDRDTGTRSYFKCEPFQRTGSFKFRGAFNALAQLTPEQRSRGVLTYSSGNHAQALALAARILGTTATVVMPSDAPPIKLDATRAYGAEVIVYDREKETREALGSRLANERRLSIIPPYDHPHVIAGQGTAARELLEETGPLDVLLAPCGGGGLLSGTAISARKLAPDCRIVGVEPEAADDATRSFRTGELHTVQNPQTIADGARTPSLGTHTFPIVLRLVDEMVTIPDDAIRETMRYLWQRMKFVVEPTGALAAAALFAGTLDAQGARVGIILSGGNAPFPE